MQPHVQAKMALCKRYLDKGLCLDTIIVDIVGSHDDGFYACQRAFLEWVDQGDLFEDRWDRYCRACGFPLIEERLSADD